MHQQNLKNFKPFLEIPRVLLVVQVADILSGKPYDPQTVTKASKPATPKPAGAKNCGPAIPKRLVAARS
jgi:hypothetical protein